MAIIPVLLLAAGASARMRGGDKLLEDVDGEPLLRRQASRAAASGEPVHVTLPPGAEARRSALAGLSVRAVPVAGAAEGMAASLRAGVQSLPGGVAGVLVVPADMPDLTTSDFRRLIDAFAADPDAPILRGATADGRAGHPVLFPHRFLAEITALRGDRGAAPVVAAHRDALRLAALPGERAVTDLDTPEDWARWRGTQ